MSKREATRMLRNEKEIVTLDAASHAILAALALEMLYSGKTVKAKLVAGLWGKKS